MIKVHPGRSVSLPRRQFSSLCLKQSPPAVQTSMHWGLHSLHFTVSVPFWTGALAVWGPVCLCGCLRQLGSAAVASQSRSRAADPFRPLVSPPWPFCPREGLALWDFTSKSLNVLLRFCRMRWCLVVVQICLLIVLKEVARVGVEVDHCDWSGGNILLHV